MTQQKIPIIYSRIISSVAGHTPGQVKEVLRGTGIDQATTTHEVPYMSVDQYVILLCNAARVSGDPLIALKAGAIIPSSAHGALGVAIMACPTLRSAIETTAYFVGLRTPFCQIKLFSEQNNLIVEFSMDDVLGDQHEAALDFILATTKRGIIDLALRPLSRVTLQLQRSRPENAAEYEQVLGCFVEYGQSRNSFIFISTELDQALPGANPEEYEAAIGRIRSQSEFMNSKLPTKEVVLNTFFENIGHICKLEEVAAKLFVTPRTLQRRLKLEATTFQLLRDEWLAQQSIEYLKASGLSIEVSSALVGYSDEANFRRAFKRWFGCAPRRYLRA
jgi:AraC-like DNA-binding protein